MLTWQWRSTGARGRGGGIRTCAWRVGMDARSSGNGATARGRGGGARDHTGGAGAWRQRPGRGGGGRSRAAEAGARRRSERGGVRGFWQGFAAGLILGDRRRRRRFLLSVGKKRPLIYKKAFSTGCIKQLVQKTPFNTGWYLQPVLKGFFGRLNSRARNNPFVPVGICNRY